MTQDCLAQIDGYSKFWLNRAAEFFDKLEAKHSNALDDCAALCEISLQDSLAALCSASCHIKAKPHHTPALWRLLLLLSAPPHLQPGVSVNL